MTKPDPLGPQASVKSPSKTRGALVVTGGSRGIGAAIVRAAAADGWRVVVNYAGSREAAEAEARAIVNAGGEAIAVRANVGDEREVAALFDAAEDKFGSISGLVNNAGIVHRASKLADISLARWNEILAINLTGTFLCSREAARRMTGSGAIVNVSSMAAQLGGPGEFLDYAASKGGVDTFTVGLAKELAARNIRVNGIRPGLIETDMQAASGDPERASRLAPTVPMQRVGSAEEVAEAVIFLLSDRAGYVTGQLLNVSGGR